ncbi:alpha/beta hydrolase [Acinetobacter pragensis]|uniref:alpha/beta hydrolase n=1 Tax=Acinetobacter pragensis TaxID=1806892 RepID=UPI0033415728
MTLLRAVLKTSDLIVKNVPFLKETHSRFPTLDPFLYQLIQLKQKRNIPRLHELDIQSARELYRKETARIKANFLVKSVENIQIPVSNTNLEARVYTPKKGIPNILVYFHGGGGVIGDLETHDDLCRLICRNSGMIVISIAYRLAPEYKFPIAHIDAFESSKWLYENRDQFSVLNDGIFLAGDSFGANLAIHAGLEMIRHGFPVLGQLLLYPSVDYSQEYPSENLYGDGLFLDTLDRKWFQKHVLNHEQLINPLISPILYSDVKLSPKTLLRTAELDVLRDEAEAYAEKLRMNKIVVNFKREIGVGHAYGNLIGVNQLSYSYIVEAVHSFIELVKA